MKDHPCLVRQSPRRSTSHLYGGLSATAKNNLQATYDGQYMLSNCEAGTAQAPRCEGQSAPELRGSSGKSKAKSVPIGNLILTGSGALGYENVDKCHDLGLCIYTLPRGGSLGAHLQRTTRGTQNNRSSTGVVSRPQQPRHLLAVHRHAWTVDNLETSRQHVGEVHAPGTQFKWPDSARGSTAGTSTEANTPGTETPRIAGMLPPMTLGGSPRTPVMNISKCSEKQEVTNVQLRAYAMSLHKRNANQKFNPAIHAVLVNRREQFLLRAIHYLGVPYRAGAKARPDQKLGPAAQNGQGLYLDCCALIRRCLLDLQNILGTT